MADTLSTELRMSLSWLFQDALELTTVSDNSRTEYTKSTADGTGIDQADKIYHVTKTINGSANDDWDLTALTHTVFGSTVTISLAKVKAILIVNLSTTSGDKLVVGGADTNPLTGPFNAGETAKVEVGADSVLVLSRFKDGWPVTNSSADILRVNNPGGSPISYKIIIIGTSA